MNTVTHKRTTHSTLTKSCLAAALGLSALASLRAGDVTDYKASKDKNPVPIQKVAHEPRFYLAISAGSDIDFKATKFLSNGGGNLYGEPARFDARYFSKVHDPLARIELTAGYNINEVVSVFGRFEYSHAYTARENIGSVRDIYGFYGTDTNRNYSVSADLKDYETFGGKAGFRVSLPIKPLPFLKPYFSTAVGATYMENTRADLSLDRNGDFGSALVHVGDVGIYRASWVLSTDARLGLEYNITKCVALDIEGGIGYDTKPERSHGSANFARGASLRNLGITGVSLGGDRLYAPLTAGVKVSF